MLKSRVRDLESLLRVREEQSGPHGDQSLRGYQGSGVRENALFKQQQQLGSRARDAGSGM